MASHMTKLEAVNELLEVIGEYPFAALDTGNTSVASDAETVLDCFNLRIQSKGWHENTIKTTLSPPDVEIAVSSVSDTFTDGETVTESTSLATGRFHQIDADDNMELTTLTGTFTGGKTLTGGTSTETATGAAATDLTEGQIVVDDAVIRIDTAGSSASINVTLRDTKLYNITDETYTFSDALTVDQTVLLDFAALTPELQAYITAAAKMNFNQTREQDRTQDAFLKEELEAAMREATRMDMENEDLNILRTEHAYRIQGQSFSNQPMRR